MPGHTGRRWKRTAVHPPWCEQGHQCGLGEHRARPVVLTTRDAGRATLTRVRGADRREHVEVRISVPLGSTPAEALFAVTRAVRRLLDIAARFSSTPTRAEKLTAIE